MKQIIRYPVASNVQSRPEIDAAANRGEPLAFLDILESLRCPMDLLPLNWSENESMLVSSDGTRRYPIVDGIPCLFAPNEWPEGKSNVTELAMLLSDGRDGGLYRMIGRKRAA